MDAFSSTILPALLFFCCCFVFPYIYHIVFKKKKQIDKPPPTPSFSLPIFGHLHLLNQPLLHRSLASLSTKYGPLLSLRFGSRPTLLVSSPSLAHHCLTSTDVVFANRPRVLAGQLLGYNYSNLGSASYGPHWRNLRRIATLQLLSTHRIQTLSAIPAQEIESLLKSLFLDSQAGKSVVELRSRLSELNFNAMMRMMADEVVDLEESKLFRRLDKLFDELAVSYAGDFVPVLGWLDFGGVAKRMRRLAREMDVFLQGLVEKQRQKMEKREYEGAEMEGKKQTTVIEVLLSMQDTDPESYTDDMIKGFIGVSASVKTINFSHQINQGKY